MSGSKSRLNINSDAKISEVRCTLSEGTLAKLKMIAKELNVDMETLAGEWLEHRINAYLLSYDKSKFDTHPKTVLKGIVEQHGISILRNKKRTENFLRDLCPNSKKEINILLTALNSKIPDEILMLGSGDNLSNRVRVLVNNLVNTTGLDEEAASYAVSEWTEILINSDFSLSDESNRSSDLAVDGFSDNSSIKLNEKIRFDGSVIATKRILDPDTNIKSLAFSNDGKLLAVGTGNGFIYLYDLSEEQDKHVIRAHNGTIKTLSFSTTGSLLASAGTDKVVKVWNTESGELEKELIGHRFGVTSVAISPSGFHIASAGLDGIVKIWEINSGSLIQSLHAHKYTVTSITFSLTGRYLATASWDETVKLWEVPEGQLLRTFYGHTGNVENILFSPDGRYLLSSSTDRTIRLWEAFVLDRSKSIGKQEKPATAMAFSADNRFVFTGALDGSIKIYENESGELRKVISDPGDIIACITLSTDGKLAAFAEYTNIIKIYKIDSL